MSSKASARRGYNRRQEEEAAPIADEIGAPDEQVPEIIEVPEPAGPNLWERFTGWVTGLGHMFVSREGAAITLFVVALGFLAMTLAGSKVAAVLMIASLATAACLAAPLVGINLGGWISRVTGHWRPDLVWEFDIQPRLSRIVRWRPNWQRPRLQKPDWLRMPELQISEASRKRIRTASGITAVVLIAILILWFVLQQPPTKQAAVVEEPVVAEPTVAAVAQVTPEPTTESDTAPAKEVVEPEPVAEAEPVIEPAVEAVVETEGGEPVEVVEPEAEPESEAGPEVEVVVEAETAVETAARTEAHIVTVESGDTVWDLLTEELGHAPTWDQIKSVVDANGLEDLGVDETTGLWIVIIHAGDTIDLTAGLAVG